MANVLKPLEDIGAFALITELRNKSLELQNKTYDKETLKYLCDRQVVGRPFPQDFSHQPNQIQQIKNFENALYLLQQIFQKLEKLDLSDVKAIIGIQEIRQEAKESISLLLSTSTNFEAIFKPELQKIFKYWNQFQAVLQCNLLNSRQDPKILSLSKISELLKNQVGYIHHQNKVYYFDGNQLKTLPEKNHTDLSAIINRYPLDECQVATISDMRALAEANGYLSATVSGINKAGQNIGLFIDQINPASGALDYDLLTWFSGVLPSHIEALRKWVETSTAGASWSLPNVDEDKMSRVLHEKFEKLSGSIQSIISTLANITDPFSLIFHLPSLFQLPQHFKQIQPVLTEIFNEVDHLDETIQNWTYRNLAKLKYEALANLFLLVDKLEIQLSLDKGTLAVPLMKATKLCYETVTQISKDYLRVQFTGKEQQLLRLEDPSFVKVRQDALLHQANDIETIVHQIDLMKDTVTRLASAIDSNQTNVSELKERLKRHLVVLKPYLKPLEVKLEQELMQYLNDAVPSNKGVFSWFAWPEKKQPLPIILEKLQTNIKQLEDDQHFRLNRYHVQINAALDLANLALPEQPTNHALYDSDRALFANRHFLPEEVKFDKNGMIVDRQQLTADQKWILLQSYTNQWTYIKQVEQHATQLLQRLHSNQEKNKQKTNTAKIDFGSTYTPCFVDNKLVQLQPNSFYVYSQDNKLHYEVLEPQAPESCCVLRTSLDPNTLNVHQLRALMGYHDGFIQFENNIYYFDTIQLIADNKSNLPRLRSILQNLDLDKPKLIEPDDPNFNLFKLGYDATDHSKRIRAFCKLFLMELKEVQAKGFRKCYVWDHETKELSYIDAYGQTQRKIHLSPSNKTRFDFIANQCHLRKTLRKRHDQEVDVTLDETLLNYTNLSIEQISDFINPVSCGFLELSKGPFLDKLNEKLDTSYYLRVGRNFFYYDREKRMVFDLHINAEQLKRLAYNFPKETHIEELTAEQLRTIAWITGHMSCYGGHYPGVIYSGSFSQEELNAQFKNIDSFNAIRSYIPSLLAGALERGDIQNPELSACLRDYGFIRDYLLQKFEKIKIRDIAKFDENMVALLSGNQRNNHVALSYEEIKPQLQGLIEDPIFLAERYALEEKQQELFNQIDQEIFAVNPAPKVMEQQTSLSPYVRDFLLSIEPIKRDVDELSKTEFRAEHALKHLALYRRNVPEHDLNNHVLTGNSAKTNRHYQWFQLFLIQLQQDPNKTNQQVTIQQLEDYIKQVRWDAKCKIEEHQKTIDIFTQRNTHRKSSQDQEDCDLSEVCAFKALSTNFELCLQDNSIEPPVGQLQVQVIDKALHYRFMHYGSILSGEVEIKKLKILPEDFADIAVLSKLKPIILSTAYEMRKLDIESTKAPLSHEEALDLYQWYQTIKHDNHNLSPEKQALLERKIVIYKKIASSCEPKPFTLNTLSVNHPVDTSRENYFLKQKLSGRAKELRLLLQEQFKALTPAVQEVLNRKQDEARQDSTEWGPWLWKNVIVHSPASLQAFLISFVRNPGMFRENRDVLERTRDMTLAIVNLLGSYAWSNVAGNALGEGIVSACSNTYGNAALQSIVTFLDNLPSRKITWVSTPEQVLAYQHASNLLFNLEKLLEELEKIKVNQDETDLALINHMLVAFLYYANIQTLAQKLVLDQHFSPVMHDIYSGINQLIKTINDESAYYFQIDLLQMPSEIKNKAYLQAISVLKLFPERIASDLDVFIANLPALRKTSQKTTENIEKILSDYESSFSYLYLFFDLPMIVSLIREILRDVASFSKNINENTKKGLEHTIPDLICKIIKEADRFEHNMSLGPILAEPVSQIVETFYKGLVTALIDNPDTQHRLLCSNAFVEARKQAIQQRVQEAEHDNIKAEASLRILSTKPTDVAGLEPWYQEHRVLFKEALNGSDLYFMSYKEAVEAHHRNGFVWDDKTHQLFHIHADGKPNEQTGSILYLKSFPAEHPLTDKDCLELCSQDKSFAIPGVPIKHRLKMQLLKPTLIQHGNKYYIYENFMGEGWKRTELNFDIISKLNLDFKKIQRLERNAKYQDLYAEIATKTNSVYSIKLKKPFLFIELIKKKRKSYRDGEPSIYLSEPEIARYIVANSNFVHKKNGITRPEERGCSFITLSKASDIDDLFRTQARWPGDYSAYYVQANDVKDALFFVDLNKKTSKKYPLNQPLDHRFFLNVKRNRLLVQSDFKAISQRIDHVYKPHAIINPDEMIYSADYIAALEALTKETQNWYQDKKATANLSEAIAKEKLQTLDETEQKQVEQHLQTKKAIYNRYFNQALREVCKKTHNLQGYELCLLTKSAKFKPNTLYVLINNHQLEYKVLDPAGTLQSGSLELSAFGCSRKKLRLDETPESLTTNEHEEWSQDQDEISKLHPYLPAILQQLSRMSVRHTQPYSLVSEYQTKLKVVLEGVRPTDFASMNHPSAPSINEDLNQAKEQFDAEHLAAFQELNAINIAINDFMLYLNEAEKQWMTRYSLFESPKTIQAKRNTLDYLSAVIANDRETAEERIKKIKKYLLSDGVVEHLLSYENYNANVFATLFQLVLRFFEILRLYTPVVVQHVDKLVRSIDKRDMTFFGDTVRSSIKKRVDDLRVDVMEDASKDVPKTPAP